MNKADLRLECLRIAATTLGINYSKTVEAAKAYMQFVEASDNKVTIAHRIKRKASTRLRSPKSNV